MTNTSDRLQPTPDKSQHPPFNDGVAFDKTCEEVLEEAILELVELGYRNGMTPDDVDFVLNKIMDERAQARRASFKMHGTEDES